MNTATTKSPLNLNPFQEAVLEALLKEGIQGNWWGRPDETGETKPSRIYINHTIPQLLEVQGKVYIVFLDADNCLEPKFRISTKAECDRDTFKILCDIAYTELGKSLKIVHKTIEELI